MMTTKNFEIIYLKKQKLDLNYSNLDDTEVFLNYFLNRILDLADNKEGKYSKISVKKARVLKKAFMSPQIMRKLPGLKYILKQAGYKY